MRTFLFFATVLFSLVSFSLAAQVKSASIGKLLPSVRLVPPYPGVWDFTLAAASPLNSTWSIKTAGGPLVVNWVQTSGGPCNGSAYAYPLFTYNGTSWNKMCQKGFAYHEVGDAFARYYGTNSLSVEAVEFAYYPHVVMSVSGNLTKLIYVDNSNGGNNHTIATTYTCAFRELGDLFQVQPVSGTNNLMSVMENDETSIFSYLYQNLNEVDSFYALSVADPFSGFACLKDGQVCWPGLCDLWS